MCVLLLYTIHSISPLRFIDFVMMALGALLSFTLSVTITAGLNQTCSEGYRYTFCPIICLLIALFGHNPSVLHNALYKGVVLVVKNIPPRLLLQGLDIIIMLLCSELLL